MSEMSIDKVKALLDEEYEHAKGLSHVIDPLAYALYQVWKQVDKKNVHNRTDLTNKCGSCKWATPRKFSEQGTFGCYVDCHHPGKRRRSNVSTVKQRTAPKCSLYERKENEEGK